MSITLIREDESLIAVDKPAGLLAVPGRGPDKQDCLLTQVLARWSDARVVHRLDMATSGLMLFARGLQMQRILSRAFAERQVDKQYVAVVDGRLADARGRIDLPLAADWPRRPLQRVDAVAGRTASTGWQLLDQHESAARLMLQPHTGRTHQLRVHLAAIGHPILGDALYASPEVQARAPRLLLHAEALTLAHPATGAPLALRCPAPF